MRNVWRKFKKPIIYFSLFFIFLEVVFFLKPSFFSGPGEILEPVVTFPVRVIVGVEEDVVSLWKRYIFLVGVEKRNEKLIEEINTLRMKLLSCREHLREMEEISKFSFYFNPVTWKGEIVPLIGRDPSSLFDSFLIYTGGKKLPPSTPVLYQDGVVGMVVESELLSAKVMLITNINSAVDVMDARSGVRGVFQGEGGMLGKVKYVTSDQDVKVGDLWITSGFDGVYPPGIGVAKTVSVRRMKEEPFFVIEAKPVVNFFKVRFVFIPEMKRYETK